MQKNIVFIEIPLAQKWAFLILLLPDYRMKKILLFAVALCAGIGHADAAVRNVSSAARTTSENQSVVRTTTSPRTTTSQVTSRNTNTVQNAARVARTPQRTTTQQRATTTATARSTTPTSTTRVSRAATTATTRGATNATTARSATSTSAARLTRATTTASGAGTNTFGTGYNACRDAYFTCMDQFCANQNDTYRRCVCSSKLADIQARERALGDASDQIQDFKNLNIEVIPKTAAEVSAMLNATSGETAATTTNDNSASAQKLAGISDVLTKTKSKSLSTAGTLDIAGDINAIWATTDLTSGANIANLTGESLYNAVHAQCAELVSGNCSSDATLKMVVAAYGMYIENDCATLTNALNKKLTAANTTIRETEREMNNARLDNYNAHNSTSINDCIAQVRSDITADTACGTDYVHCLDTTGLYLNRDTGEPIYSANFYQLENQISLSGDVLTNPTNRMIVAELNRMRTYAARGLDTCRDMADDVWDEFLRQAIAEIYQGQQTRIRTVKTECLDVVNACYDEQSKSLKDFSNIKEQLLIGSRLELSEQLCQEKLNACSNLYSSNGDGLELLLQAMHNITDQKIAKECATTLSEFVQDTCAVPSNDSLHKFPYGCRVYAPGAEQYAGIYQCNQELWARGDTTNSDDDENVTDDYHCPDIRRYNRCKAGYYLTLNGRFNTTPAAGNACTKCPTNFTCAGGVAGPVGADGSSVVADLSACGDDYIGSLYQKVVRYALQACVRPSESNSAGYVLPTTIMADVNTVMDSVRVQMSTVLSAECERLGGVWVDTEWKTENGTTHTTTGHKLFEKFYSETGTNTKWGYCRDASTTSGQ